MSTRFPNICQFIQKNGNVCNSACQHSNCHKHLNKKAFIKCSACEKLTNSKFGYCTPCGIKIRAEARKQKKKLEKDEKEIVVMKQLDVVLDKDREHKIVALLQKKQEALDNIKQYDEEIEHFLTRLRRRSSDEEPEDHQSEAEDI